MNNDLSYFTVKIPPSKKPTEWHSDCGETLTRGVFKSEYLAHQWAHTHLEGNAYAVYFYSSEPPREVAVVRAEWDIKRRPRSNPRLVEEARREFLSLHTRCTTEMWTYDRYINERRAVWERIEERLGKTSSKLTIADTDAIDGYALALWDAINSSYVLLEWKLGLEDVSTAIPSKNWEYRALPSGTRNVPTHGAHFWAGTNKLWSPWSKL